MRKTLICLSALFVVVAAPGLATGQVFLPPSGWDLYSSVGPIGLYLGYAHWNINNHGITSTGAGSGQSYHRDSMYLGAALPVPLGNIGNLTLKGAMTIPGTTEGSSRTYGAGTPLSWDWTVDSYWSRVEARLSVPVYGGCSALAGFRWENFQSSWKNRRQLLTALDAFTDTMSGDTNAYLPFVGVETVLGGLTVSAIGFPTVPGTGMQKSVSNGGGLPQTFEVALTADRGYFLEVLAEYAVSARRLSLGVDASASIFAILTVAEQYASGDYTARGGFINLDLPFEGCARTTLAEVGGKVALDFDLASLLPF